MVKPTYQFIGQMLAALGVIISMGMVAYELKLSRDVAIAELMQEQYHAYSQTYMDVLDVEAYNRAAYKFEVSGEELTWAERKNSDRVDIRTLFIFMGQFHLWEMGLLKDGEWEDTEQDIKAMLASDTTTSELWKEFMLEKSGSFDKRLRELWVEVRGEEPVPSEN